MDFGSWRVMLDEVQTMLPDLEPSIMISAAAAACTLVLTPSLFYIYSRCTRDRDGDEENTALANIHFYAGSPPASSSTQKCIKILKKYPHLVNKPLSEQYLSHAYTPFLRACWNNNYELILYMINNGASINITNSDGETAMYLVAYRVSKSKTWDPRALNLLWSKGCSVDEPNVHNNTMLHLAAKAGNSTLVRWLLLHGADPDICNNAGFTARRLALKKGLRTHLQVAELLHTWKDNVRRVSVTAPDGITQIHQGSSPNRGDMPIRGIPGTPSRAISY